MLNENQRDITVLCRVVDNFGDIGFCWRLSRSLLEVCPEISLRLVVSDLASFSALDNRIDASKSVQSVSGIEVFDWNDAERCKKAFGEKPPRVVLECFQCGRPDWLEEILFYGEREDIAHIINVEYLTAEDWADEFHCLKSATRSKFVKKVNFMPGFSKKTGGLVLDKSFMQSLSEREYAKSLLQKEANIEVNDDDFNVVVFSYERDFTPVVRALSALAENLAKKKGKRVRVFLTEGKSRKSFLGAIEKEVAEKKETAPFLLTKLPFLTQSTWDALLTLCDFNFVRGEDSMARACLCGVPFVWHAYPQEAQWQTVKVNALMKKMALYFSDSTAAVYAEFMREYNKDNADNEKQEALLEKIFSSYDEIKSGVEKFSKEIIQNGNLAENLVNFIAGLQF